MSAIFLANQKISPDRLRGESLGKLRSPAMPLLTRFVGVQTRETGKSTPEIQSKTSEQNLKKAKREICGRSKSKKDLRRKDLLKGANERQNLLKGAPPLAV